MKVFQLAVVALLVSGCSQVTPSPPTTSELAPAAPTSSQSSHTTTETSPSAESSSSTEALDQPSMDVEITCRDEDGASTFTGPDFRDAWASKSGSCDATAVGSMTLTQLEALQQAYGEDTKDYDSITYLLAICAQNSPAAYDETPWTDGQVKEQMAAFTLCPDNPQRGAIEKRIKEAQAASKKAAAEEVARERGLRNGTVFTDGTYRVGGEVKPGRYFATDVDGCYWERQDSRGETIDNNFINSAKRVEVRIRSTDYGFNSEGCGDWRKIE